MAGVQVIWFSVPVTCIYANVTTLLHFLTISCQYAHVFCIHQSIAHVVHYKPTDKLNLIVSLNVWRPCKWFTFHCYVVMSCILTTVQQFSTTFGPHWNVTYTLLQTACVLHHRSAVCLRILSSLAEWQACKLSDFQCRFTCIYAKRLCCIFSPFPANVHAFCIHQWSVHVVHKKPKDKLNLIASLNVWRPCKWFTFHCNVVMCCILTNVRQFSTTLNLPQYVIVAELQWREVARSVL